MFRRVSRLLGIGMKSTQVHFERTGGFAGIRLATSVDTADLPEEEARALEEKIQAARFFEQPGQMRSAGNEPDRFQYKITVEQAGKSHTVEVGETSMPEDLQPLVEHLGNLARTRR
jgi:hypothetical protein